MAEPFGDKTDPRYKPNGKAAEISALDVEMVVTFWPRVNSLDPPDMQIGTGRALIEVIKSARPVSHKEAQELLNLGRYADQVSSKGSYRNDANRKTFSGVEIDSDQLKIPLRDAMRTFETLDIGCIGYETASCTDTVHKFRLLFPCSQEYAIEDRPVFVAFVEAMQPGICSPETFKPSLAYFFGRVEGGRVPAVMAGEGGTIDRFPSVEAIGRAQLARMKTEQDRKRPPPQPEDAGVTLPKATQAQALRVAIAFIHRLKLQDKRDGLLRTFYFIGGWRSYLTEFHDEDIIEMGLVEIAKCVPPPESMEIARAAIEDALRAGQAEPLSITHVLRQLNIGLDAARAGFADTKPLTVFNPWAPMVPTPMPSDILAPWMDDAVRNAAERDGICPSSLAMAYLAATCCCVDKRSRVYPYNVLRFGLPGKQIDPQKLFDENSEARSMWSAPLIVWQMLIAPSGGRKTRAGEVAFKVPRHQRSMARAKYMQAKADYEREKPQMGKYLPLPAEPYYQMLEDQTVENIQKMLARGGKGGFLYADELALVLSFNRYGTKGQSNGAREFLLEGYEGSDRDIGRISREAFTTCNALGIYGHIQPAKLSQFPDLDSDGVLQRFNMFIPTEVGPERPDLPATGIADIEARLQVLLEHASINYLTEIEGAMIVREMTDYERKLGAITEYGLGWSGAAHKLHGTLCRYAGLLHVLDAPGEAVIPTATMERADRLVRKFLLPQMLMFYRQGVNTIHQKAIRVGEWILTSDKMRITARDVKAGIWAFRNTEPKDINALLENIASWEGWLDPENQFPNNRAWIVHPDLRMILAAECETLRQRQKQWHALQTSIEDEAR